VTEVLTLAGADSTRWTRCEIVDSLAGAAKTFTLQLENTDDTLSDTYETYDTVVIATEGITVFSGRMESIDPRESDGYIELEGSDYIGDLQGEYIIEAYGIAQDIGSNISPGSSVVISIADTTGFEEDDEVKVSDSSGNETATITSLVLNTSITVDTLTNSYTTARDADVTVGELGSDIIDDLVEKYGPNVTRTGIQTSTMKFIKLYKGKTAYDAIQEVADAEGYVFGHNSALVFFYQPRKYEDSELSIDLEEDPVVEFSFPKPGYDIINRVDVYGGVVNSAQVSIRIDNLESQKYYGITKTETIIDDTILTENAAYVTGMTLLDEKAWVVQTGELSAIGYETLESGQLITLRNFESIDDGKFLVTEIRRDIDMGIIYLTLAKYAKQLENYLLDLILSMRSSDAESIDEDALQSKFLNFYETEEHTDNIIDIVAVSIGDGYIAGHPVNSICGRGYEADNEGYVEERSDVQSNHPPTGFTLAHTHTFSAVKDKHFQISDLAFSGKSMGDFGGNAKYRITLQAASLYSGVETTIAEGEVYFVPSLTLGLNASTYSESVLTANYTAAQEEAVVVKYYFNGDTTQILVYSSSTLAIDGKQLVTGRYFKETVIL